MEQTGLRRRRRRLGLYAPFLLLGLLAVLWTAAWFLVVDRARAGLDEFIAREATAGRLWSCADRSLGGYPFRIELGCSSLSLSRPDVHASIGRVVVVSQVYRPHHIIAEASGPLRIAAASLRVDGSWRLFQASVIARFGGIDRLSLAADGLAVAIDSPGLSLSDLGARRFEAHFRGSPQDAETVEIALRAEGASIPGLDALAGGDDYADLLVRLAVNRIADLPARPLPTEMERWRAAGGRLTIEQLSMRKGTARLEAQGSIGLDPAHRPEGQIEMAAAGVRGLLGRLVAGAGVGTAIIGLLLGTPEPKSVEPAGSDPALRPLPPLRLSDGRVFVGPLPVPGLRLQPLY